MTALLEFFAAYPTFTILFIATSLISTVMNIKYLTNSNQTKIERNRK